MQLMGNSLEHVLSSVTKEKSVFERIFVVLKTIITTVLFVIKKTWNKEG